MRHLLKCAQSQAQGQTSHTNKFSIINKTQEISRRMVSSSFLLNEMLPFYTKPIKGQKESIRLVIQENKKNIDYIRNKQK
jgi:hypothetical protein